MSDSKGVRYGISNAHYALYTEGTGSSLGTYATPVAMKGATQLTLTPQGNTWTFYADDVAYETGSSNTGYEVSLTVAVFGDQAKIDLLGYATDANGVVYEPATAESHSCAFLWEFGGSKVKKRGLLYNVKFNRPTMTGNTKTDSVDPDTDELTGTAIGRDITIGTTVTNVIKASVTNETSTATRFNNWFSAVYIVGATGSTS
jgi:phi13 family phage major tail protein